MNIKSILIAALLGTGGGFSSAYYVIHEQNAPSRSQLPPIVIVDLANILAASADTEQTATKIQKAVAKLKAAGYLVLDGSAVIGAPEAIYLPAEWLQ